MEFFLARLSEEVEGGNVLPLWMLHADPMRWHSGPPDAPVCGLHQINGNLTLDLYAYPQVGLLPICCEAAGYNFLGSRCLHIQYPITAIKGGNEGRKMAMLRKADLQVHLTLYSIYYIVYII